jgi:hypothetical protein
MKSEDEVFERLKKLQVFRDVLKTRIDAGICEDFDEVEYTYHKMSIASIRIEALNWVVENLESTNWINYD